MLFYTLGQSVAFLAMLPAGFLTGVIWDGLRALRRLMRPGALLSLAMDLMFCLTAAFLLIGALVRALHGEVRLYAIMGSLAGFLIYGATVSPLVTLAARGALCLARAVLDWLGKRRFVRRLLR